MHRSLKALSRSHKDQVTYLILFAALFPLLLVASTLQRLIHKGTAGRSIAGEAKDKTSIAVAYAFMG